MAWSDTAAIMLGSVIGAFNHADTFEMFIVNVFSGEKTPVLRGVFDSASIIVDPETGAPVSSNIPRLGVAINDLEFIPNSKDHEIEISGAAYKIDDIQRDGVAGLTLFLKRVRTV